MRDRGRIDSKIYVGVFEKENPDGRSFTNVSWVLAVPSHWLNSFTWGDSAGFAIMVPDRHYYLHFVDKKE